MVIINCDFSTKVTLGRMHRKLSCFHIEKRCYLSPCYSNWGFQCNAVNRIYHIFFEWRVIWNDVYSPFNQFCFSLTEFELPGILRWSKVIEDSLILEFRENTRKKIILKKKMFLVIKHLSNKFYIWIFKKGGSSFNYFSHLLFTVFNRNSVARNNVIHARK